MGYEVIIHLCAKRQQNLSISLPRKHHVVKSNIIVRLYRRDLWLYYL